MLDAEKGPDEIEIDGGPHLGQVGAGDRAHVHRPSGVGEQDVEPAAFNGGGIHRMGHLLLDGHVGHHIGSGALRTAAHRRRPG